MTLSGTDTLANYQAALRAVTYADTSSSPSTATRTVSFQVNDGLASSNVPTRQITVTAGSGPVILDNSSPNVTIVGAWTASTSIPGYYGSNYLTDGDTGKGTKSVQFTPALPTAGVYTVYARWPAGSNRDTNVPIDVTSASGTTTVMVNQQLNNNTWVSLGSYSFTAGTAGSVTIRTTGTTGYVIADAVEFVASSVNAPVLAGIESGPLVYTAGNPATPVTATITTSDAGSPTLAGATVWVSGNYQSGQDQLSFPGLGNITGSWNAATGTMALSGTDTLANYQAALRAVTYSDTSSSPSTATRTVSFQVNDGLANSDVLTRQIRVTPVIVPPALAGIESGPLVYTSGNAATAVTAAITVGDTESPTLASATVWISGNYQSGQDVLAFTNTATITGNWNTTTGTLTLSGIGTLADYQAALRAVTYADSSSSPIAATRTVSFQVNDGLASSNVLTRQITVIPVVIVDNSSPNVTIVGAWTASTSTPGYYGSNYLTDGDSGKGTKSVQFTPSLPSAGVYHVFARWPAGSNRDKNVPIDITSTSGTTTVMVNQQLNNNVWVSLGSYSFAAGTAGSVTIRTTGTTLYVIADAVEFVPLPVLAGIESAALAYTAGSAATPVTAAITTSDAGSLTLAGATVWISGNYQSGEDVLSFAGIGNITGSWNATTGTMTLSGTDTLANYQAALQAVMYDDTSSNPSTLTRTVSFQVSDGLDNSNVLTRQITVTLGT